MGYYSLIQLPPKRTSITKTLPFQEQLEKMAATAALENFHNNIRTLAQTKRIRVTEFFQDFDKLRSGFVTGNQQKKTIIHCIIGRVSAGITDHLSRNYDYSVIQTDIRCLRTYYTSIMTKQRFLAKLH